MRIKGCKYGRAAALAMACLVGSGALSAADASQAKREVARLPSPPASPVVVSVKATLDIGKEPIAVHVLPESGAASETEVKARTDTSLANATWGLFVATFMLFLVTGGLFAITVRMAADAKRLGLRQTAITRRALRHSAESNTVARAGRRPWVKFSVAPGSASTDDGSLDVILRFTMKNVGFGPALNVYPHCVVVPTAGPGDERDKLLQAQDALIKQAEVGATNMGRLQGGLTIFPGDEEQFPLKVNLAAVDVTAALALEPIFNEKLRSISNCDWVRCAAVGTILYRDGDGAIHHTRFAYGLSVVEGFIEGSAIIGEMPIGPHVSSEQLVVSRKFWAGNLFLAD